MVDVLAQHFCFARLWFPNVGHVSGRCVQQGGQADPKCDTWSLGALLYIMLSGCMPFRSRDDAKARLRIVY
eukprot:934902-Amphidinium_carterae.2